MRKRPAFLQSEPYKGYIHKGYHCSLLHVFLHVILADISKWDVEAGAPGHHAANASNIGKDLLLPPTARVPPAKEFPLLQQQQHFYKYPAHKQPCWWHRDSRLLTSKRAGKTMKQVKKEQEIAETYFEI